MMIIIKIKISTIPNIIILVIKIINCKFELEE